ncbi:MAG: hypothetical protein B1H03_05915 [Planctomycetales bacterium 4484_113]|nr:MAG: hypothetical protein B1H03_05915 [Planctomycetales bacterium 4484_113]
MQQREITIRTPGKEALLDITAEVQRAVSESGVNDGVCHLLALHTTAGLTINENADPSVKADILMALKKLVPDDLAYSHAEGNSPAHIKSTLTGHSLTIPIANGRLVLGTWQGVMFCEFDGPRHRKVYVHVVSTG